MDRAFLSQSLKCWDYRATHCYLATCLALTETETVKAWGSLQRLQGTAYLYLVMQADCGSILSTASPVLLSSPFSVRFILGYEKPVILGTKEMTSQ